MDAHGRRVSESGQKVEETTDDVNFDDVVEVVDGARLYRAHLDSHVQSVSRL